MNFKKFADLMIKVGFKEHEPITLVFTLNKKDLNSPVFREGYSKVPGLYRIRSVWAQNDEIAFWACEESNPSKFFPFSKEEVDYLAKKKKFRKS